mmetsp:Transcript_8053/g.15576  ORF Transcript_8053/g.15576 Transcript_8053/m.15576 type:complete len:205 (+) Transcript_8053:608-1222(+)
MFWCRRRDSNSHSFRHYPLKIACLPISPRRLVLISSDNCGGITCQTASHSIPKFRCLRRRSEGFGRASVRRCRCRGRSRRRRDHGSTRDGGGPRCGRRRRHNGCPVQHAVGAARRCTAVGQEGQAKGAAEEQRGGHGRAARQEVGTAGGAEQAARRPAAKRGPHVGPLAMLHQHQTDDRQGRQQLNDQHQIRKELHSNHSIKTR